MNRTIVLFLIILLITNCSLDNKTGLWTKSEKIKVEQQLIVSELFKKEKSLSKEFNSNVKIQLSSYLSDNNFLNNSTNNSGRANYNGNLQSLSKFKYSKIDNFNELEPEIIFEGKNIIFFDNKGSILKFDQSSKLIWKKNYYKKTEKKQKPILSFASNEKILVVVDNFAKYYALNIKTGELLWSKRNSAPFNSQIKIYKDKFFVTDFDNILKCFSIKDGKELWNVTTETTFIKSQKKLSLVILGKKIYFNNSIGDISAVDVNSGNLIWQTPTQSSAIYESAFLLKTSDLVADAESILLSNNKNEFFSINSNNGVLNWKQKINSNLRPAIVDNLLFTVTMEGFLIVVESSTGNIIRVTNVFDKFKSNKKNKIKPVGFLVGTSNIYLTTSNGRLIIIDILSGKSSLILKIDNEKISRPFILNENLYIVKDNAIIKLD